MRSSIENFNPAVKPGNQTELGTRAYPFANYITSVHRQIHKLFAFGFLADLEQHLGRGKTAYDDETLFTKLEIVINPDGTVNKVNIVHSSGVTGFDVAAIDSVISAAPFEVPPKAIRSADGKTYIHWGFHRNELACIAELGTNVEPYILTTPGETPKDDAATLPVRPGPRTLSRELPRGNEAAEPRRESTPSPSVPAGVPEVTQEARDAAQGWFAAYSRGSVSWLAGWSATPFTAAGEVIARDGEKLKAMYKQLVAEAPKSRTLTGFDVLTPAGIRGKLGGLPPGGEDTNMLYAVGRVGSEEFILLLKKSNQGWRVCGVDR
jgi:TonB family protein